MFRPRRLQRIEGRALLKATTNIRNNDMQPNTPEILFCSTNVQKCMQTRGSCSPAEGLCSSPFSNLESKVVQGAQGLSTNLIDKCKKRNPEVDKHLNILWKMLHNCSDIAQAYNITKQPKFQRLSKKNPPNPTDNNPG